MEDNLNKLKIKKLSVEKAAYCRWSTFVFYQLLSYKKKTISNLHKYHQVK